jgi:mRNA interferase MazF
VLLSAADGMPAPCALNFDHVSLAQRARSGGLITTLAAARWAEVERALLFATGFASAH